jgi:preprotein translocase SecE subunit
VPGLRAGSALGFVGLFIATLLTIGIANLLAHQDLGPVIFWGGGLVVGGAVVVGLFFLFQMPAVAAWLVTVEHQGWFHATSFKPNQGKRVRIATQISLLAIILFGVWSGYRSDIFRTVLGGARWPDNQMTLTIPGFSALNLFGKQLGVFTLHNPQDNWIVPLPSGDFWLFLLFNVQYTAPILFVLVLGWFALRVTNWPTFADFLIATEAEMNKVSWTTRKRLIQDTIVVLVTVVLLTVFLFVVDILWIRILSVPGVLQFDPQAAQAQQRAVQDW